MEVRLALDAILDSYMGTLTNLVPLDITEDIMTYVVLHISGGAGLGGTEAASLYH